VIGGDFGFFQSGLTAGRILLARDWILFLARWGGGGGG